MKNLSKIYILTAAVLWGAIGLFVNSLSSLGFSQPQIVLLRSVFSVVTMIPVMLLSKKGAFRVKLKDIWCFIGTGTISLLLFNICYFYSMQYNGSLAVAAILLYTAPAFVTVISAFLFKEKLTKNKLFSLLLMFSGCVFVSGVFSGGAAFSVKGILFGLGSGIGYAMYSIFGRYAINRGYKSETISFYTFVFCLAGALFICDVKKTAVMICSSPRAILLSAGIGFICCVLPYVFYTKGLETTENSTASILATAEPLVASLIGIFVYKDSVTVYLIIGIILMITGIITMNLKKRTENDKTGV